MQQKRLTITNIKVSMVLYNLCLQLRKPLSQDTVVKRKKRENEKGQGKFILRYQDVQLPLVYCTFLDISMVDALFIFFITSLSWLRVESQEKKVGQKQQLNRILLTCSFIIYNRMQLQTQKLWVRTRLKATVDPRKSSEGMMKEAESEKVT